MLDMILYKLTHPNLELHYFGMEYHKNMISDIFHHVGCLIEMMTSYDFFGTQNVVSIKVVRIMIVISESFISYNTAIHPS